MPDVPDAAMMGDGDFNAVRECYPHLSEMVPGDCDHMIPGSDTHHTCEQCRKLRHW